MILDELACVQSCKVVDSSCTNVTATRRCIFSMQGEDKRPEVSKVNE